MNLEQAHKLTYISTQYWNNNMSYEKRRAAFRASKNKFSSSKRSGGLARARSVTEIKKIARSIGETKYILVDGTLADFDSPRQVAVTTIGQGDGINQRTGNKITMQSMEMRCMMTADAATSVNTTGFWAIILDREPNGAVPVLSEIYDTTATGASTDPTLAFRNPAFIERFKIIAREDFTIGPDFGVSRNGSGIPSQLVWHKYFNLSKLKDSDRTVRYNGTTATYSNVQQNALYAFWVPSNQTAFSEATNYPKFNCTVRMGYKDI